MGEHLGGGRHDYRLRVRRIFCPHEPPLRSGEFIAGSNEARDDGFNELMPEWYLGKWVRRRRQGHARHSGRQVKRRG